MRETEPRMVWWGWVDRTPAPPHYHPSDACSWDSPCRVRCCWFCIIRLTNPVTWLAMKISVTVALEQELLGKLDAELAASRESRSAYVGRAVEKALGGVPLVDASGPKEPQGSASARSASASSRSSDWNGLVKTGRQVLEESVPFYDDLPEDERRG